MPVNSEDALWTIVAIRNEMFAVPVRRVETMVMLPGVTKVPEMPPYVRGVFVLRGRTVPVIDLRTRLGMESLEEETEGLISMLSGREQDHRNWLDELERSVQERREFKLTTDPHACAFGRWYDNYTTDSLLLQGLLRKFDAPHKRIHAIAEQVLALEKSGDSDSAAELIAKTRGGDLAEMLRLFEAMRVQIRDSLREIAVVVSGEGSSFAVAVDSVETVTSLVDEVAQDIAETGVSPLEEGLVSSVGKLERTGELVIVLDTQGILGTATDAFAA